MNFYLSTSKKGYGVKELLLDDPDTYWRTSSILPHWILITSSRIRYFYSIKLFLSYKQDDSYTPQEIEVAFNDETKKYKFSQPEGFQELNLNCFTDTICIRILENHAEGKDTKIHGLKLYESPTEEIIISHQ